MKKVIEMEQKKTETQNEEKTITSTVEIQETKPHIANPKAMLLYKLAKARNMLKNSGMKKSGKNNFQNFEYFELADMLPPIDAIFEELLLGADFEMTPTESILTIMDLETGYELIKTMDIPKVEPFKIKNGNKIPLPPEEVIKTKGKLQTYSERYLWIRTMHISEADPIDLESGKKENKTSRKQQITVPKTGKLKLKEAELYLQQQGAETIEEKRSQINQLKKENRLNEAVFNKMMSDLDKEAKQ